MTVSRGIRAEQALAPGMRFGRLITIERVQSEKLVRWKCQCDCGRTTEAYATVLRGGHKKSCGCLANELAGQRARKHGGRQTVEYVAWQAMIRRCESAYHPAYKNYGGRGITVCTEWRSDFTAFLACVGPRPSASHSIDRIDNDRGYEPGNVRWVLPAEQARNKRTTKLNVVSACLIRHMARRGSTHEDLAYAFGVSE